MRKHELWTLVLTMQLKFRIAYQSELFIWISTSKIHNTLFCCHSATRCSIRSSLLWVECFKLSRSLVNTKQTLVSHLEITSRLFNIRLRMHGFTMFWRWRKAAPDFTCSTSNLVAGLWLKFQRCHVSSWVFSFFCVHE